MQLTAFVPLTLCSPALFPAQITLITPFPQSWFLPKHSILCYATPKGSSLASHDGSHTCAGSNPFGLQGAPESFSIDTVGACFLAQLRGRDGWAAAPSLGDWSSPEHRCLYVVLCPHARVCVLFVCIEMSFYGLMALLWWAWDCWAQGIIQVPLPATFPLCCLLCVWRRAFLSHNLTTSCMYIFLCYYSW